MGPASCMVVVLQALYQLEYPDRLQKLLLTPNREMGVELVVQVGCLSLCLGSRRMGLGAREAGRASKTGGNRSCS